MDSNYPEILLNSEIGRLRAVVLHKPGGELEDMTPQGAHAALYSDLLSKYPAQKEYSVLEKFLSLFCNTYYYENLLAELAQNPDFLAEIKACEDTKNIAKLGSDQIAKALIEGYENWKPLYNLYFTRDIGVCFGKNALPLQAATSVRRGENFITKLIYKYHPLFKGCYTNAWNQGNANASLEGGDFFVLGEDKYLIGLGSRSNLDGIKAFIDCKKKQSGGKDFSVIYQELPSGLDSYIHLDMVFTLLGRDKCMVYKPLLSGKYKTRLLQISGDNIKETAHDNILSALKVLGIDPKPIYCGNADPLYQEREQWHSGANFFTVAPNHILGYDRNQKTLEALNNAGFEIKTMSSFVESNSKPELDESKPCLYSLYSAELVRGGGGCRCMTMPISRFNLD